jgi:hypothetical protein
MERTPIVDTLREAAQLIGRGPDAEALRAIQVAQDALDAAKVAHLAGLAETRGFEAEGASSVGSWARLHLRIGAGETSTLTRAAATLARLPRVAEAAVTGRIRAAHVNVFSYGLKHVGAGPVEQMMDVLLGVATTSNPAELMQVMRALREAVHPDELDQSWARGMDKADLQVNAVPEGYHVQGFLPTHVGATFSAVIASLSAPVDADDTRTGAQRRVDAIDQLCEQILNAGLPSDNGVRPHLGVRADAETVHAAATRERGRTSEPMAPADLSSFGPIGPALLAMIGCTADVTPILTRRMPDFSGATIVNVGRTQRLATSRQRTAVLDRQDGRCAAPGCRNTHLQVHHVVWWSHGGPTDLDNLIGLCSRCHHLVHRDLLVIRALGQGRFAFTDRDDRALLAEHRRRRDVHREAIRIYQMDIAIRRRRAERARAG